MIAFIDDHREAHGVEPICKVLPIAPSTYRAHVARRARPETAPARVKRDAALKFGATHAFESAAEAQEKVTELTWGQGADAALILVGTVDEDVVSNAFAIIGKGGRVVITGLADPAKKTVHVSGAEMALMQKTVQGTLFGSMNPQYDIVKLLRMYDAGELKLDELITQRYTLDEVNKGYEDLRAGVNLRGVIDHAE